MTDSPMSSTFKRPNPPAPRVADRRRRIEVVATVGGAGVIAAVVLVAALAAAAAPWLVGVVLAVVAVGVVVLGAHAGGHGLFVPIPVLGLVAAWATLGSLQGWTTGLAWVMAGSGLLAGVGAAALVAPAVASKRMPPAPAVSERLPGLEGRALSALDPIGVVQVGAETWTAESVSGPLAPGTPVRVVSVDGVRLFVWSEEGEVPGTAALGSADPRS